VCEYDEAHGQTCRGDVKREDNGNPARLLNREARSTDEKRRARRLAEGSKEIRAHASYISDVCIHGCIYIYIYIYIYVFVFEGSKEIRAHSSYISDVCTYGCIYIYIYIYICICIRRIQRDQSPCQLHLRRLYIWMYMYIYTCVCICMQHIFAMLTALAATTVATTNTYAHTRVHKHANKHTHKHTHTNTRKGSQCSSLPQ